MSTARYGGTVPINGAPIAQSAEEVAPMLASGQIRPRPAYDRAAILRDIAAERQRQTAQWGEPRHDFPVWLTVLIEEVGEVSRAILGVREASALGFDDVQADWFTDLRGELVQVAAVAVAMIERVDEVLG